MPTRIAARKMPAGFRQETMTAIIPMTVKPSHARMQLYDALIGSLIDSGIWAKLDLLYVLAAHDQQAARINLVPSVGTFNASTVNTPTFVVDRGYTGDGSTSRLRTFWTPSTNGVQFAQDSASMWAWSLTSSLEANGYVSGSVATNPQSRLNPNIDGTQMRVSLNDATLLTTAHNLTSIGLFGAQRRGAADKRTWRNGVQIGATATTASTGLSATEQWICGANATNFSARQIAAAAWGAALTDLEAQFYNALLTYMQGVGAA